MRALVVTQGDPRGVGPELILRAADEGLLRPEDQVVAGRRAFEALRVQLPPWAERGWARLEPLLCGGDSIGQVAAIEAALERVGPDRALVTAPIDKAAAHQEGLRHAGHTELLAERSGAESHAMVMIGPRLRVALATVHLPLREVAQRLETRTIVEVAVLLWDHLHEAFGIERPRIGILGLNPHAGERGLLGTEDQDLVAPAVDEANRRRSGFGGPLPADSAFHHHAEGVWDGLVAMYHDQGLGPFKLAHFHEGVNVTLGLPFVRSSPDHGTARDIAGQGVADPRSFFAALRLARGEADPWGR